MRFAFFSTDGNDVAAAGSNADIYVFSAETMKRTQTLSVPTGDVAYPVSFSADDKTLYAMDGTAGKLYVFDIATGKATHVYTYTGVSSPGYTHGGSVYAIETSSSGTVAVYEMATNKLSAQVSNPGKAPIAVAGVTTDGDGKYILISDTDGVSYLVAAQSKAVIGTFHYTYSGNSTIYPQLSLDGNTVYVPGGSSAPAKLWDRATRNYVTPTDARWPALDNGVTFSTDSRFVITSPSSATETVDVWNVATHAHVITLTVPGGANEGVEGIGPGASELLSTASLDINAGTFPKLNIWSIPS
jgi:WD40 repeat protein